MGFRTATRFACLALAGQSALAHVPFLETTDYTDARPFEVNDVSQSKALYGWLESSQDIDFYAMQIKDPTRIYTASLVPMCTEYARFAVSYALVGPGLPPPSERLPFDVPPGIGAIIVHDAGTNAASRPTLYEQFSARYYYEGPELELEVNAPGEYRMVVWNDAGETGDYVAVIGRAEKFGPKDMWRAARHTVTLRRAGELHHACTAPPAAATAKASR